MMWLYISIRLCTQHRCLTQMQPHHVMWSKWWSQSQSCLSLMQSPSLPCTHTMEQHSQQQMGGMEWCTHWGHVLSQHSTEASKILYFTVSIPLVGTRYSHWSLKDKPACLRHVDSQHSNAVAHECWKDLHFYLIEDIYFCKSTWVLAISCWSGLLNVLFSKACVAELV